MGLFFNKKKKAVAGTDYCLFCGMDLVNGVCSRCGREAKPMVGFDAFAFKPVPTSVAAELGEQKKSLFGNSLQFVQEMIQNGNLFIADILFDSTAYDSQECDDDDGGLLSILASGVDYDYYVQFSTPDGTPCDKCCRIADDDFAMVEELMGQGQREGWLLKGIHKKNEYYYAFAKENASLGSLLQDRIAESLVVYGTMHEKRRPAPKGVRDEPEFRHVINTSWDDAQ